MTLNLWVLASLIACHFPKNPSLAKVLLAYTYDLTTMLAGIGVGGYLTAKKGA